MTTDVDPTGSAGGRLRRNWPWLASLAVVLITAGILIGSALSDDALQARPGDVVYSNFQMPTGYSSSLELPVGRLDIKLTKALTTVHNDENMAGREAPDGGSFVGIETTLSTQTIPLSVGSSPKPITYLGLVVGNHRYRIARNTLSADVFDPSPGAAVRAWVAVAGAPDDVQVSVEYDGVTQTVDPSKGTRHTGRAAGLYGAAAAAVTSTPFPNQKRCGTTPRVTTGFTPGEPSDLPECRIGYLHRVPYVAGLGWAPKGRSWLVAAISVDDRLFLEWHHGGASYRRDEGASTGRLTLPGVRSAVSSTTSSNLVQALSSNVPGLVGFFPVPDQLPAGTSLHVSVVFAHLVRGTVSAPAAPLAPTVRISWTVAIP